MRFTREWASHLVILFNGVLDSGTIAVQKRSLQLPIVAQYRLRRFEN